MAFINPYVRGQAGSNGATGAAGATGATGTLGLGATGQVIFHNGTSLTGSNLFTFSLTGGLGLTGPLTFLRNNEYIRNTTDGAIDIMPGGTSSSHYGLRSDAVIWGFGPSLYAVRASDDNITAGAIRFMNACVLGNDTAFAFGNSQAFQIRQTSTGLDTMQ